MADTLREELGVQVELVPGGRGVFDVSVDGIVVANKSAGFPSPEACVEKVRAALAE
ncbi:MAG: putative Rdx family selenoprotein [Cognaticolwellia sp.]